MHKRSLHYLWARIRPAHTWYFLAVAVVFGTIGVFALRANYTHMTELREAVYAADKNNGDIEQSLQDLRAYVNTHMNTNLSRDSGSVYPPIQLQHTYERLTKAEKDRVNTVNSQVYTEAQHYCEQQYPGSFSGGPRVPCIEQYVKDHGTKFRAIPADLYRFSFTTPVWSPDLAGWSLALCGLFLVLAACRFLLGWILRLLTK